MPNVKVFKAVRTAAGFITGLSPVLTPYQLDGTALAPIDMVEVPGTGTYFATVNTAVELIGAFDAGAGITDPDDRFDRLLIHPDAENVSIIEAPAGTYEITFRTRTSGGAPIPNVNIQILNAGGQVVRTFITDSNGEKIINQDAGDYTAVPQKAMVDIDPFEYTVAAIGTVVLVGDVISPTAPAAGIQTVYGTITLSSGASAAGSSLEVKLKSIPQTISGQLLSAQVLSTVVLASYFELAIVKGAQVEVIAKNPDGKVFMRKFLTVTAADTKDLSSY